ncbi:MAG: hypothetical protein RLZZ501_275 [Pseudomonadota bacterium]|jgi:hypothetical protein
MAGLIPLTTYTGAVSCRVERDRQGAPVLVLRAGSAPLGLSISIDEAAEVVRQFALAATTLPHDCITCRHGPEGACPPSCTAGSAWAPVLPADLLQVLERSLFPDQPEDERHG